MGMALFNIIMYFCSKVLVKNVQSFGSHREGNMSGLLSKSRVSRRTDDNNAS